MRVSASCFDFTHNRIVENLAFGAFGRMTPDAAQFRAVACFGVSAMKRKAAPSPFPHVPGLQKKRTKNGHRWILSEPDFSGVSRSITVKISDNDPPDVFLAKVTEARKALRRRCACQGFAEYVDAYVKMRQYAASTETRIRRVLKDYSFDEKRNAKAINRLLESDRAPGTKRLYLETVRSFFAWLIQRGETIRNPAADVTIKAPRGRRTRTATDQELAEILAYARKTDPEHRLFILLLVYTGARGSTILALTPDSLDADQKLHMFNVKAKKRYDFPIQITNRDLLDTWKTVAKRGVLWLRKWHEVTFSAWLRRHFGKDANGEYLSAHSMRHTFATRALQSGVPLEIVSKLLDHASVSTTLSIYAKFSTEQIDNAVKCTVDTIPDK
jgi:integrase